ncbi:hypothetical protein AB996_1843 [Lactococcus cremoris]|uniref:Uncharacterized protein n=1 Tax=Lactococcus lactis subsp. cremoris TaxID=1359 RepID=A0A166J638_LACLC|nr:hypothetical protein AB996_1843 [Lactococcus cremoris]
MSANKKFTPSTNKITDKILSVIFSFYKTKEIQIIDLNFFDFRLRTKVRVFLQKNL